MVHVMYLCELSTIAAQQKIQCACVCVLVLKICLDTAIGAKSDSDDYSKESLRSAKCTLEIDAEAIASRKLGWPRLVPRPDVFVVVPPSTKRGSGAKPFGYAVPRAFPRACAIVAAVALVRPPILARVVFAGFAVLAATAYWFQPRRRWPLVAAPIAIARTTRAPFVDWSTSRA